MKSNIPQSKQNSTFSKKLIKPLLVQQPPLLLYCSEVRRKITKRSSGLFEIGSHPPSASTATMASLPSLSLYSLCVEAKVCLWLLGYHTREIRGGDKPYDSKKEVFFSYSRYIKNFKKWTKLRVSGIHAILDHLPDPKLHC